MEKRIAVIFPGVGYHVDKPLLYYSRKLAGRYGYEIVCADYGILPSGIGPCRFGNAVPFGRNLLVGCKNGVHMEKYRYVYGRKNV